MEVDGINNLASSAPVPDSITTPVMDIPKADASMQKNPGIAAESDGAAANESPSAETSPVEAPSAGFTPINSPSAQAPAAEAQSAETSLVESSPLSSPRKRAAEDDANIDGESVVSKKPKNENPATNGVQRKKASQPQISIDAAKIILTHRRAERQRLLVRSPAATRSAKSTTRSSWTWLRPMNLGQKFALSGRRSRARGACRLRYRIVISESLHDMIIYQLELSLRPDVS